MSNPRRAGQAAAAFNRAGLGSRPANPAQTKEPAPTVPQHDVTIITSPVVPPPAQETKPKPAKYTMLLDQDEALAFDQLALNIRTKLGRKIDKSVIVKVLLALTADDPTLLDAVTQEIRNRSQA